MHHAAEMIVGSHDFRSYSRPVAGVEQYRCTITFAFWEVDGSLLRFRIGANRFMRGMVRALVGTMVDVGRGHISLNEFGKILPQRDRSRGGMSAPARGLVLERVLY